MIGGLNHPDHVLTRIVQMNGELRDSCSCGLSWTHPIKRSIKEADDIYQSHLKYFDKPATQTL